MKKDLVREFRELKSNQPGLKSLVWTGWDYLLLFDSIQKFKDLGVPDSIRSYMTKFNSMPNFGLGYGLLLESVDKAGNIKRVCLE